MKHVLGLAVLLSTAPAFAATITWDPAAAPITSTSVVDTTGTLFASENTNGAAAAFGGVNFGADANNVNYTLTNVGNGFNGFSTSHPVAGADAILADAHFNGPSEGPFSLNLNNLSSGSSYTVQIFMIDDRSCCSSRTAAIVGGPSLQDYSTENGIVFTGRFVADGPTQTITGTIDTDPQNGFSNFAQINAFQVRLTAVPEPATLSIVGTSAAALLARRRRC